jgi:hypothetical protein
MYKGLISILHQVIAENQQAPTGKEEDQSNCQIDNIHNSLPELSNMLETIYLSKSILWQGTVEICQESIKISG